MEKTSESTEKKGLQGKIILGVVLSIIIIFTVVVGVALKIIGTYLMQEADEKYQTVTENVAQEITTWFSNESEIVMNHKASIEIIDNYDPDYLTAYLTRIVEDYNEEGYIYDLYFVNTENVMSSGYGYIPDPSIDFRTRDWYKDTMDIDGLFYSTPYKDSNLDRYVVTISTTVYKKSGELAGVLALDIFVDTLFAIAEDKVIGGNSYVFLVDNNVGLATHPNPAYEYVDDEPRKVSDLPGNTYKDIVDYINGDDKEEEFRDSIIDYDGVERAIYVSKIDCCGLYVVAAIESNLYTTPLVKTLMIVVGMLIICLIIGILSTRIVTSKVIRQLNIANEEARHANEAKGIFLANMSHEIRTPINAIIGMNEMVIRENTDPTINDYALDIASASKSLVSIVNDVLDFSKIESGKMEIVENEFNIASIVNDIVNMSESRLGTKNLELIFHVDPNIPVGIIGDEMRIKQVILNMMTNAIKYTESGYVAMRMEFTRHDYGINLDVFVRDSGIGISEENLDNLYQSFQRFDTKRTRSIEGTGLGLAITKRLIESMGGFINVTSKLGEGSEFSFSIPLKVSKSEPFVSLEKPDSIHMVALLDTNYKNVKAKEEFLSVIDEMRTGLGIDLVTATDFADLKNKVKDSGITHVVLDRINYLDNDSYYGELSNSKTVIVVQKRLGAVDLPSKVIGLYAPLFSLSLAATLNNKKTSELVRQELDFSFEAPEAKILIVDDNSMNLKVAAGLVKPYNMKVMTVDSGEKAIEILKADPTFDIVFMDHMMPIMDGIEATKIIRDLPSEYYQKLPIVALTANTINNAKNMFLSSGFDDFVAKPININSLDRVLKDYLPKKKMQPKSAGELGQNSVSGDSAPANSASGDSVPAISTNEMKGNKEEASKYNGLDIKLGLTYTANNKELYLDVLKEYVETANKTKQILADSITNGDWKNYVIRVHGLKSTSLSIGAVNLSNLAKELEHSGKAGNNEPIINNTQRLFDMYDGIIKEAKEYLKENFITVNDSETTEEKKQSLAKNLDSNIVNEYGAKLLVAIQDYDTDGAESLYKELCEHGEEYGSLYAVAMDFIRDFEYQKAEEEIGKIIEDEDNTDN